jgi:hypothetical protein
MARRPQFTVTQVSNYGTSTPAVARTVLQTRDLIQAFPLSEEKRLAILDVSLAVQRRLLACQEIADGITREVDEGKARAQAGLRTQAQGRVVEIPSVLDLQPRAESFLYQAKLALRDIAGLFKLLVGQHFDENYKQFIEWAEREWGADDHIVKMLQQDRQLWLTRVLDMRNGVEHPTHRAGPLVIRNFTLDQTDPVPALAEPTWGQGEHPFASIVSNMEVICHNLLTLYEDLLSGLLLKLENRGPIDIAEIPEAERDPTMPKRLRVVLTVPLPGP